MTCSNCKFQAYDTSRSRPGFFKTVFQLLLVYVGLVFASGTLIQTGHPVASEVGEIIRLVTFVDPLMYWADGNGFDGVSNGLGIVSRGVALPL